MNHQTPIKHSIPNISAGDWQELVRQKVSALRFGVVQLVVHEGRVVQIECTEKVRLERTGRDDE